jgi:hypothetical protein
VRGGYSGSTQFVTIVHSADFASNLLEPEIFSESPDNAAYIHLDTLSDVDLSLARFLDRSHVFVSLTSESDLLSTVTALTDMINAPNLTIVVLCDTYQVWSNFSILATGPQNVVVCPKICQGDPIVLSLHSFGPFLSKSDFIESDDQLRLKIELEPIVSAFLRRSCTIVLAEDIDQVSKSLDCIAELAQRPESEPIRCLLADPSHLYADRLAPFPDKLAKYGAALTQATKQFPHPVVAILDPGRGNLVDLAISAGAETVFLIEHDRNAFSFQTNRLAKWPNVQPRSTVFDPIDLPQKVDILVSEMLNFTPEILAKYQKFLSPNGITIPRQHWQAISPVSSEHLFFLASQNPVRRPHVCNDEAAFALAEPQECFHFSYPGENDLYRTCRLRCCASRDGLFHGLLMSYFGELFDEIVLEMAASTHWTKVFLPLSRPVRVRRGETIEVSVTRNGFGIQAWWEWSVTAPAVIPIQNRDGLPCLQFGARAVLKVEQVDSGSYGQRRPA